MNSTHKQLSSSNRLRSMLMLLASCVFAICLIGFLFAEIEWSSFINELRQIRWHYVLALCLLLFLSMFVRALRWRILLPSSYNLRTRDLLDATLLGFFASSILPFRAGEIVRPLALTRFANVPFFTGFASIVNERVFDVLALLFFIWLCIGQMENVPMLVSSGAWALGVICIVIVCVAFVGYACPTKLRVFAEFVLGATVGRYFPSLVKKLLEFLDSFLIGLRGISSIGELILVFLLSVILWSSMGIFYHIGMLAFGQTPSLWVGFLINIMIALAVAAPSAPGFVGTFQLGCIIALNGIYGYSKEFSGAYSIFIHAVQMVFIIILGTSILCMRGVKLTELRTSNNPN